jgi:hypothetical protein
MSSVINTTAHSIGNAGVTTGWKYNVDLNIHFGVTGVSTGQYFYNQIPDLINGATLDSVTLYYQINGSSARTPTTRLSMRFTSAHLMAQTPVTLYATTGAGAIVNTVFATTGNNVIDTSLYTYVIVVYEEVGGTAVAGNNVYSFKCNYTVTNGNIK